MKTDASGTGSAPSAMTMFSTKPSWRRCRSTGSTPVRWVRAVEPADVFLDTLLVRTVDAGLAVEGVEPHGSRLSTRRSTPRC